MIELRILDTIEEQMAVGFTGKVNVLSTFNRQYLGHILFKSGDIIQVFFNSQTGLKALYQIIIQEFSLQSFQYVVEPEVVDETERQIHYPFSVIKSKMADVIKQHKDSLKFRPPENVKILISPEFVNRGQDVTLAEFEVLKTVSEWNKAYDIYQHCQLLDFEITWALVNLRKKGALKILASKNNQ